MRLEKAVERLFLPALATLHAPAPVIEEHYGVVPDKRTDEIQRLASGGIDVTVDHDETGLLDAVGLHPGRGQRVTEPTLDQTGAVEVDADQAYVPVAGFGRCPVHGSHRRAPADTEFEIMTEVMIKPFQFRDRIRGALDKRGGIDQRRQEQRVIPKSLLHADTSAVVGLERRTGWLAQADGIERLPCYRAEFHNAGP